MLVKCSCTCIGICKFLHPREQTGNSRSMCIYKRVQYSLCVKALLSIQCHNLSRNCNTLLSTMHQYILHTCMHACMHPSIHKYMLTYIHTYNTIQYNTINTIQYIGVQVCINTCICTCVRHVTYTTSSFAYIIHTLHALRTDPHTRIHHHE